MRFLCLNLSSFFYLIGHACFVCEKDVAGGDPSRETDNSCPYCRQKVMLDTLSSPILVSHVGAHILHDARLKDVKDPCGFCLRSGMLGCNIYLKTTGKTTTIDMVASQCPQLRKISLKAASHFTAKSPCTNHPIRCPLCPPKSAAIWKYNFRAHITASHCTANPELYHSLFGLEKDETILMKAVLLKVPRAGKKAIAKGTSLVISNVHSSRCAVTR